MLAISSRGIWVNPCNVCTIGVLADILVQYDIGTTADTKVILVIKPGRVSDKIINIIQRLHVDFNLSKL